MLSRILITTSFSFGCCYPLFFWINNRKLIETGFYRFNLGFSCFAVGIGVGGIWLSDLSDSVDSSSLLLARWLAVAWFLSLLIVTAFFWTRQWIKGWLVALPSIIGVVTLCQIGGRNFQTTSNWEIETALSFLGSAVLCASIFAGVLGHWYLNATNLPISLLAHATRILWGLLGARLLWNSYAAFTLQIGYRGDQVSIFRFLQTIEGLLLGVGLFFGVVFPLILTYMVYETVKVKSTQSATGILYVVVTSVLMGELAYKYYLLEYGLVL